MERKGKIMTILTLCTALLSSNPPSESTTSPLKNPLSSPQRSSQLIGRACKIISERIRSAVQTKDEVSEKRFRRAYDTCAFDYIQKSLQENEERNNRKIGKNL